MEWITIGSYRDKIKKGFTPIIWSINIRKKKKIIAHTGKCYIRNESIFAVCAYRLGKKQKEIFNIEYQRVANRLWIYMKIAFFHCACACTPVYGQTYIQFYLSVCFYMCLYLYFYAVVHICTHARPYFFEHIVLYTEM